MAVNIGPRIGIDGEAEYRKQIQGIITETKTLKTEMSALTSSFDKDKKTLKENAQQRKLLTEQIDKQKEAVSKMQAMLDQAKAKTGENSAATQKWEQAVNKATTELNEMKAALKDMPNSIQLVGQKMKDAGDKIKGVGEAFAPVSAAAAAGLGASVKLAADFESQMSKVGAISGSSGDDIARLSEKARQMGAETKFSATEAGQAMEYMAMAGWKTEDMLSGVAGVMNLAAASGEDLALTSDIVTDALTAFGLSAEDSAHFADVIAAASSNANTNVAMLGESFKYAAPVAGAMGYSAEDVSIALGLMANSGIKASQAGTSLRTALSNMANPTENMVGVMNQLGLSLTDENGKMKSLHDVMDMLRTQFSVTTEEQVALNYAMAQDPELMGHLADGWENMSDAQQKWQTEISVGAQILEGMSKKELKALASQQLGIELTKDRILTTEEYNALAQQLGQDTLTGLSQSEQIAAASTLFGKNAMAGMLAILNASDDDYQKLTKAIYGADGAAENMAATMQNNLNGQLTILKSGLEEAGISIGNALLPAIKGLAEGVQNAVTWFNNLDEGTKTMVAGIGVAVAAFSPLAIGLSAVITAVSTITTAIGGAVAAFTAAGGAAGIFGAAIAAITSPVGIAIAAIAGVVAAGIALYKNWDTIKAKAGELATAVSDKWTEMKEAASQRWNDIKETVSQKWDEIKQKVSDAGKVMLDDSKKALSDIQAAYVEKGGGISGAAAAIMTAVEGAFTTGYDVLNSLTNGKFGEVCNTFNELTGGLLDKAKEVWEGIKQTVQSGVDKLKQIMNFKWELPKLKLPHFKVSGEFSLRPPSAPHFEVDWYAKAMKNGIILNRPTIFGANGNTLLGGGEAGPEAVVGVESLMNMIQSAVQSAGTTVNNGGITINVMQRDGEDSEAFAHRVADIINADVQRGRAAWA